MPNSFYPIVSGRTSDAQRRTRALFQLQVDQIALQRAQEQISTGLRFTRVSEDPSSAIRVINIQSQREFNDQALTNLQVSQSFLNVTESNLSESQDLLNEARSAALSVIDTTRTPAELESFSIQIDSILDRLVSLGNARFQDRSLFAGGLVREEPFEITNQNVQFRGNELDLRSTFGIGEFVQHNVTGQTALGVLSEGVTSVVDLNPGVIPSTRLADLNGGFGINNGAVRFESSSDSVTIDFANAETLEDIRAQVENIEIDGRRLNLDINPSGLTVNYLDGGGGTLRIVDIGVGRAANDLGISTDDANPTLPIVGRDLDPILRETTSVNQFNGGFGFNLQGGIEIQQGSETFRVELAAAETVEDILNEINTSGASVVADIAPGSRQIRIRSFESGSDFSIGESTGDLARRLGIRSLDESTLLSELNYGRGVSLGEGPDLTIGKIDGNPINVELQGAITVQDVLERINSHVDNQDAATRVVASLNTRGNGITLSSQSGGTDPLTIRVSGGSEAAWNLGLLPVGETEREAEFNGFGVEIVGTDPNPQEVRGAYNSLVRLRDGIRNNDTAEIARAANLLDEDLTRLTTARGSLGVDQQRIDSLIEINEERTLQLTVQESDERDADLAQVITELTARQAAQEASLRLLGQTAQLSLFDFL